LYGITKKIVATRINRKMKMEYKNIFNFNISLTWKSVLLLLLLSILPNWLGMYHYTTTFGLRIHFFQYLIFVAAIIYGPIGGLISGAFGSIWTAISLNNPYIVFGNMILGFFAGLFLRYGLNIILSVLIAYLIQLPWLWFTDIYLANMPIRIVKMVVVALLFSDILCGFIAWITAKPIREIIK